MITADRLAELATERGISKDELAVLTLAVVGKKSLSAIASHLSITDALVRKRLGNVYKAFHITGSGPGKLARLQQLLVELSPTGATGSEPSQATSDLPTLQHIPDFPVFYGRQQEMDLLSQWISGDRCRLVTVLGASGMGKTALVAQVIPRVQDDFESIVWRSLDPPMSLSDLLHELGQQLRCPLSSNDEEEQSEQILSWLQHHRVLIVLDDIETILKARDPLGLFLPNYQIYGDFLQKVGEIKHQSCFVLCGQEKPGEISLMEDPAGQVRTLPLKGLQVSDAQQILQERNLDKPESWPTLIEMHRGNPLELKLVATTIEDLFGGDVATYVSSGTMYMGGNYQRILEEQFQRLSDTEQAIIQNLLSENNPISIIDLRKKLDNIDTSILSDSLKALQWRSWVEQSADQPGFVLQPVIKKYAKRLYEQHSTPSS